MPKVPKITSLQIFAISQERNEDEFDFLYPDKHESFLQVDSIFFRWAGPRRAQSTQTSLQYLSISQERS